MAKGDFYFPLFYKRLLTSTIGWTDAEFGCYLRLLIYQFDNGSIPNDLDELSRIAPTVKKHWKLISKKFFDNKEGALINEVMDETYHSIQSKKQKNKEFGMLGGRPKKNRTVMETETETKPNGFKIETETKPIPITNNKEQITKENTSPPAFDLSKSNLNRQPVIPTKNQVWESIQAAGGTKEMAKSFYEKHEGTGWFINGSPIVNYSALAQRFVTNWKENEKSKSPEPVLTTAILKKL